MINLVIVICLCIISIIMIAFVFSRSQSLQRFGIMEFLLVAAVVVSAFWGYLQAKQIIEEQYFQLFAVHFGNAYSYISELENSVGTEKEKYEELEQLLTDILPITTVDDSEYRYINAVILKRDETDNYFECFAIGNDSEFWSRVATVGTKLVNDTIKNKNVSYDYLTDNTGLMSLSDRDKIAPEYAIVAEIPLDPLNLKLNYLKGQYSMYGLVFLMIGTCFLTIVVFKQSREIKKVIRFIGRVSEGKETWLQLDKLEIRRIGIESNEMRSLYNSLRQIATDTERKDYLKYKVLQAYYRFAPKEIEKLLNKQSMLDVEPTDRIHAQGTLAFVALDISQGNGEQEYVRQLNENCSMLSSLKDNYDGIILAGNSELSVLKMMFRQDTEKALHFGIDAVSREMKSNMFVLLHTTSYIFGVAGDDVQTFTYIHSKEMNVLEKYVDMFRDLGIKMAVTDRVYEQVKNEAKSRYIGFVKDGDFVFKIYEILDAYTAKERLRKIDLQLRFQKALNLFYQSDFYLARNTFSEVLKECPTDEVAKWYLFLCESYLNGNEKGKLTFALFESK